MKTILQPDRSLPRESGPERITHVTSHQAAVLSKNGAAPIALVDLTLPQLAEAYDGLSRLEKEYENMSGICATLKGLVLLECKTKPELKGQFKSWVIKTFPKSYKTATRYMRLAEAFGKSDSTGTFQALTRDLAASVEALKQFQLDLSHPVVAQVARWVNGRGAYQLMLDFPSEKGGRRTKGDDQSEPEDPHGEALEAWTLLSTEAHDRAFGEGIYKAEWDLLTTAELAQIDSRLFRVHELFRDALRARKGK